MRNRFIRIFTICFVLAVVGHIAIVATSNKHFYRALANTVFEGRMGPSIDQFRIYPNHEIRPLSPNPWSIDSAYNQMDLSPDEMAIHQKYQTVAFCVVRSGKLLFEHYAPGYRDTSHTNSWSMAKSIVSILIGIAHREGKIKNLDDPIHLYLPAYKGSNVSIRHLLAMSSDINFKEDYINPFGFAAKALFGFDNRKLVSNYHPRGNPGQIFDYQSGNTLILGYLLKEVTGKSLSAYAEEKLWSRIGATESAFWSLDEVNQEERAFCCFNSGARDFARIGQLYLQRGIWNGDTIVNPDYVEASTSLFPMRLQEGGPNDQYGLHWWVTKFKGEKIFYARGIKGQYIFVIPSSETVIVRLGRKRDETKKNGVPSDVWDYLKMGSRISEG